MALYKIHQDLINMVNKLELECKTDSIRAVVKKINSLLISLQKHNTIWALIGNRELLIQQGREAAASLNAINITDDNVADVKKLREFFNAVAGMFGNNSKKYKETIFEHETVKVLNKTANLKEISLAFEGKIKAKIDGYQQEKDLKAASQAAVQLPEPRSKQRISKQQNSPSKSITGEQPDSVSLSKEETEYLHSESSKKGKISKKVKKAALGVFEALGQLIPVGSNSKTVVFTLDEKVQESKTSSTSFNPENVSPPILKTLHKNELLSPKPTALKNDSTLLPNPKSVSSPASIESSMQNNTTKIQAPIPGNIEKQHTIKNNLKALQENAPKIDKKSDNSFSCLEICIMAGLSLTVVGLLLVIPYAIYKTCSSAPRVDEPQIETSRMCFA